MASLRDEIDSRQDEIDRLRKELQNREADEEAGERSSGPSVDSEETL